MFEIKVLGIAKAKSQIGADWPTHIISIINDAGPGWGATTIDRQHDNHVIYNFHDVEDDQADGLVLPSKPVMQDILDTAAYWELNDDSRLLVHCTAGKSRSTAVAIAVLVQHGVPIAEAINRVNLLSPAMFPNRLMIELLDECLGLNGELISEVKDWYARKIIMIPGLSLPNRGGFNR